MNLFLSISMSSWSGCAEPQGQSEENIHYVRHSVKSKMSGGMNSLHDITSHLQIAGITTGSFFAFSHCFFFITLTLLLLGINLHLGRFDPTWITHLRPGVEKAFSSLRLTSTYKHLQRFTDKLSSLRPISVTLANYCVCAVKWATKFNSVCK